MTNVVMDSFGQGMGGVCAVVVTYNPEPGILVQTMQSLLPQVNHLILVDNSGSGQGREGLVVVMRIFSGSDNITYELLGENRGIAYAQNFGINLAIKNGYNFAILSDQDTIYPSKCLDTLLRTAFTLKEKEIRFAAIAPAHLNSHNPEVAPFFLGFGKFWLERISATSGFYNVSAVISSGQMIDLACIGDVGLMDERLFIDWVDFEWCWRAIACGYSIIGTFDSVLEHQLGDGVVKVGDRSFGIRTSVRNYFIARNGLYLSLYSRVIPFGAALGVLYRVLVWSVMACLVSKPHLPHFRAVIKGMWHGVVGRLGRL